MVLNVDLSKKQAEAGLNHATNSGTLPAMKTEHDVVEIYRPVHGDDGDNGDFWSPLQARMKFNPRLESRQLEVVGKGWVVD